jgi:hypothetical protein
MLKNVEENKMTEIQWDLLFLLIFLIHTRVIIFPNSFYFDVVINF